MLGFTEFLEGLTQLATVAQILAGLGLVTLLLAVLKRNTERRYWVHFKHQVDLWMTELRETESRHPNDLDDDEWTAKCERLLTDSGFSPLEINELLPTAVIVAKGIAADRFFM